MTEYMRTEITEPKEAFDTLRDEFFVEKYTGDKLVLIHEASFEDGPLENPVLDLLADLGLRNEYQAIGQGIHHESELPAELQDDNISENVPSNDDWSADEINDVLLVIGQIAEMETDYDHVQMLRNAQERLYEMYDVDTIDSDTITEDITEDMVSVSRNLLSKEGIEYQGDKHPNNVLTYALEFIEIGINEGDLPDPET